MDDDLDDYKLETTIHKDFVLEISYRGLATKVEEQWFQRKELGSGSFGRVRLEETSNGKQRAVKVVGKSELNRVDYKRELAALIVFSRKTYHQYEIFVNFLGWWESTDSVYLAMEHFQHGDLGFCNDGQMSEDDARTICRQLLKGLQMMHAKGYAHRDLKPENIFVVQKSPSWLVKIGDFGISKRAKLGSSELRTTTGTLGYEAPEIHHYVDFDEEDEMDSHYTHAVDIWSLGCVIFQIVAHRLPFPSSKDLKWFCKGRREFPTELLETYMTQTGMDFLKELLQPLPQRRPIATKALELSWLTTSESVLAEKSIPDRFDQDQELRAEFLKAKSSHDSVSLQVRNSSESAKTKALYLESRIFEGPRERIEPDKGVDWLATVEMSFRDRLSNFFRTSKVYGANSTNYHGQGGRH